VGKSSAVAELRTATDSSEPLRLPSWSRSTHIRWYESSMAFRTSTGRPAFTIIWRAWWPRCASSSKFDTVNQSSKGSEYSQPQLKKDSKSIQCSTNHVPAMSLKRIPSLSRSSKRSSTASYAAAVTATPPGCPLREETAAESFPRVMPFC